MPGYILHLTAAAMLLEQLSGEGVLCSDRQRNAFFAGNLLPDAVEDKTASHFRNPRYYGNMVEYPDLERFLARYPVDPENPGRLGYFFHLYIDRCFFREYLPQIVNFQDEEGRSAEKREEVAFAWLKRKKQRIPIREFFSEDYYYGDYTKMNTWLVNRYHLPLEFDVKNVRAGVREVDERDLTEVLGKLWSYLETPECAVQDVRVFEVDELLEFIGKKAEIWASEWKIRKK